MTEISSSQGIAECSGTATTWEVFKAAEPETCVRGQMTTWMMLSVVRMHHIAVRSHSDLGNSAAFSFDMRAICTLNWDRCHMVGRCHELWQAATCVRCCCTSRQICHGAGICKINNLINTAPHRRHLHIRPSCSREYCTWFCCHIPRRMDGAVRVHDLNWCSAARCCV